MTLEEGTGMADEKNRRGKLHHPVTDPLDHIQPLIYLSSVSSMYHHKEEPMKTLHFPTTATRISSQTLNSGPKE